MNILSVSALESGNRGIFDVDFTGHGASHEKGSLGSEQRGRIGFTLFDLCLVHNKCSKYFNKYTFLID